MSEYYPRSKLIEEVHKHLKHNPIVTLQGPRQCGKTTLAKQLNIEQTNWFDLHSYLDVIRLEANNASILGGLYGLVVIDEAQLKPELFPLLRHLADRPDRPARFILLGSSSTTLLQQVSESLAGRNHFIDMSGFSLEEVGFENWKDLWIKGAFPEFFKRPEDLSMDLKHNYIKQFINHDLRDIAETKLSETQLRQLLEFVASAHGQSWNHSAAAKSLGVSYKTVQRHIEILEAAFIIRRLIPYNTNTHKRLRKSPKLYVRDSGLLHAFHDIESFHSLISKRILGFSWEGFVIEQVIAHLKLRQEQCFAWSLDSGSEIDLVFKKGGNLYGVECKFNDSPKSTRSLTNALQSIPLKQAWIIHPGPNTYQINDCAHAVSITNLDFISAQIDSAR